MKEKLITKKEKKKKLTHTHTTHHILCISNDDNHTTFYCYLRIFLKLSPHINILYY